MIVDDMVYFSFVCLLKLILYNCKPQNQICDWNQKRFCFVLQKSKIKLSTWLKLLSLRFLYIIGCSGPKCAALTVKATFLLHHQYAKMHSELIAEKSASN